MPLSRKYSPIVHPVYGAKNCRGAESDAVAATIVVYFNAPASSKVLAICEEFTGERFIHSVFQETGSLLNTFSV